MDTISKFCEQSNIPADLIRATVRQAGGWDSFKEMAEDVTNNGAAGGFHGFTYYRDTEAFTKRNKDSILRTAKEMAEDMGEELYTMIGGFNCLKISPTDAAEAIHNPRSEQRTTVYNALAWFALEEVSRSYADMVAA